MQKRKKRRAKGPSRLSFADEVDGDGDTDDDESEAAGMHFLIPLWNFVNHICILSTTIRSCGFCSNSDRPTCYTHKNTHAWCLLLGSHFGW